MEGTASSAAAVPSLPVALRSAPAGRQRRGRVARGLVTIAVQTLPDVRLGRRLQVLVDALGRHAKAALGKALPLWAERKAAYRFFDQDKVTPALLLGAARPTVVKRVADAPGVVLAIQDTTSLNFSHRPATTGLGPLGGTTRAQGFHVHSCLAVDAERGLPLGLLAQRLWARHPAGTQREPTRRTRLAGEKESQRWADIEATSLVGLPETVPVVSVADAEGDLYTWFTAPRPVNAYLLVRVAQAQRSTLSGSSVLATAQAAPIGGRYSVAIQHAPHRPPRRARCRVRWTPLTLRPPRNGRREAGRRTPVALTVLLVEEETPPAGGEPLQWLLLTSWPIRSWEDAARVIVWYTQRWLVERYHYVLKTGCQVEALQLQTAARLERAVAVYCLVAVQVLWLTYLGRAQPNLPCELALDRETWQTLWRASTPSAPLPALPPPLGEAMQRVAKLGGFLARRGDGDPGPITIWRGIDRLHDMVFGYRLALGLPPRPTYG
jgi:Transposase Tn5 dimerisation domain/Transposase DNA-binding